MHTLLPVILIAAAVGLPAWVVARIIAAVADPERRKIQQRLSSGPVVDRHVSSAVSEMRARPITYRSEVAGFSAVLVRWWPMERLHRWLIQAYPDRTLTGFLGLCAVVIVMVSMLSYLVLDAAPVALFVGFGAVLVPVVIVNNRRGTRQRVIAEQIPEALDFLSRVLRSGHSFSTGLQMLGDELPHPLGVEFRRAYDQHSVGASIDQSLRDMARRIQSNDFAFFVTAVLIQKQTGGDLSEVLENISGMIRARIRLGQQVRAKTAEGRLTGYVLVAFPAVLFVVISFISPTYSRTLTDTSVGQKMLALAVALQALGLWSIKKVTTIRV
jgi:tight adherence protein B